jgi:hypothetical protein
MNHSTRAALIAVCLSGAAHASDTVAPTLTSLQILSPADVNVISAPGALSVRVGFTEDSSGMFYALVQWDSPSGQQTHQDTQFAGSPMKTGSLEVQTPQMSLYQEPGAWKLNGVTLCDRAGNCSSYLDTQIDPFLSPRTANVVNTRSPDVTKPTMSAGVVLTPTVSLSAATPLMRVRAHLTDDIAGVHAAYVCFKSPSGLQSLCPTGTYSHASLSSNQYMEVAVAAGQPWETGTWTMYLAVISDVPGNYRAYNTNAQLNAVFTGGKTLTVTP